MTKQLSLIDHKTNFISKVLSQYKDSPKFFALLEPFVEILNDLEDQYALFQSTLTIDSAAGHNLDLIGDILNSQVRPSSDEVFRQNLYALIFAYNSDGRSDDIYKLLETVVLASQITLREIWYPLYGIHPSLDLRFDNSVPFPSEVTFERDTPATYYDGFTKAKAEENLLVLSQNISVFGNRNTEIISTSETPVFPNTDVYQINYTANPSEGSAIQKVYNEFEFDKEYTLSFFLKYINTQYVQINYGSVAGFDSVFEDPSYANFDIQNGIVGNVINGRAEIINKGNGWYLCAFTSKTVVSVSESYISLAATNSLTSESFEPLIGEILPNLPTAVTEYDSNNTFSVTAGSNLVNVQRTNHGLETGDYVFVKILNSLGGLTTGDMRSSVKLDFLNDPVNDPRPNVDQLSTTIGSNVITITRVDHGLSTNDEVTLDPFEIGGIGYDYTTSLYLFYEALPITRIDADTFSIVAHTNATSSETLTQDASGYPFSYLIEALFISITKVDANNFTYEAFNNATSNDSATNVLLGTPRLLVTNNNHGLQTGDLVFPKPEGTAISGVRRKYFSQTEVLKINDNQFYVKMNQGARSSLTNVYIIITLQESSIFISQAQLEQREQYSFVTITQDTPISNEMYKLQTSYANQPRIDYDPVTGECKGLLIEEGRTNLLTYSEDFRVGSWQRTNILTTNNIIISPNGTLTAGLIQANTSFSEHNLQYVYSVTSGLIYTWSIYLKAANTRYILVRNGAAGGGDQLFIDTNTWSVVGTAPSKYSISHVGNEWYRVTLTGTAVSSTNTGYRVALLNNSLQGIFAGDGYSGVYVWGAQVEVGAFPTSYIPTNGTTAQRDNETLVIEGSSFENFINDDQGTFYIEHRNEKGLYTDTQNSQSGLVHLASDEISDYRGFAMTVVDSQNQYTVYSRTISDISVETVSNYEIFDDTNRIVGTYNKNDLKMKLSVNGSPVEVNTYLVNPANFLRLSIGFKVIGGSLIGDQQVNGHIKRLVYWPNALSNEVLQDLTGNQTLAETQSLLQPASYTLGLNGYEALDGAKFQIYLKDPGTPTNKLYYSQDFDQSDYWIQVASRLDTQRYLAPDGTLTAYKLIATSENQYHRITQSIYVEENKEYTISLYVKAADFKNALIREDGYDEMGVLVEDLDTTPIVSSPSMALTTDRGYQDAGNGWYRVWATGTFVNPDNEPAAIHVRIINDSGASTFVGDDQSGILIWGFQVNYGTLADYEKTVGPVDYQFLYRAINLAKPAGVGYLPIVTSTQTPAFVFDNDPDPDGLGFSVIGGDEGGYYSLIQPEL